MSSDKKRKWLRPISEAGGSELSPVQAPVQPQAPTQPQPVPHPPTQPQPVPQPTQPQPMPQFSYSELEGGTMDILSTVINTLNTNPYFIGMLMLVLNLGGRFLSMELTEKQEAFLQQRWLRPFLFFTVIFIATRNLAVAFWMTLALFLLLWILANEKSPFCIIPSWRLDDTDAKQKQYEANLQRMQSIHGAEYRP